MSYDLEFFQLRDGVTIEEINDFIASDAYETFEAEMDALDEQGEDSPLLPGRFFNEAIPREELERLIGKAYIEATIPPAERSDAVRDYLESGGRGDAPEEISETLMDLFEWFGPPGTLPVCFGYGEHLEKTLEQVADMVRLLEPDRIVLLDPQIGKVVGAAQARELLRQSAIDANEFYKDILRKIESGEMVADDDEDE
jgi:hypothetical protein